MKVSLESTQNHSNIEEEGASNPSATKLSRIGKKLKIFYNFGKIVQLECILWPQLCVCVCERERERENVFEEDFKGLTKHCKITILNKCLRLIELV